MNKILGIDLDTTNSYVAVMEGTTATVITNPVWTKKRTISLSLRRTYRREIRIRAKFSVKFLMTVLNTISIMLIK
jgi:molecular chaperone DnaK (HSP70)